MTGPGRLSAFSLPMFEHVAERRRLVRTLLGGAAWCGRSWAALIRRGPEPA
ncbi:hypothetical protein HS041_10095 [Planomonospora sp. ID67723]|uniref:hypothetical protein n=1 Tax=Planomonospora sp. ID67723 TaxID=2738134 RepID=UPI0018C3EB23|nr:hypothetical protein [Planomonospora sp. ID67723]MBG0828119.1 hypothetical protein [Planomonospora sp. ID67723]